MLVTPSPRTGDGSFAGQVRKHRDFEERSLSQGAASVRGRAADLEAELLRIDGQSYGAYHAIAGGWAFPGFTLWMERIQGDAYARPSRCRVVVEAATAGLPPSLLAPEARRTACADFLARRFAEAVSAAGGDVRQGEGGGFHGRKGGEMGVDAPGQYVLQRSACRVREDGAIEVRFTVGLPAAGRSVLGRWAADVLCRELPRYVASALAHRSLDQRALERHADCIEDSRAARAALKALGLVAWVADGSILPRASGASALPLAGQQAVPTRAPEGPHAVTLELPHRGRVRGLGIPAGVTLVVGGGFHGKSTLLQALEAGVYDKVPGDGRELAVADARAAKVRAEDGRRVAAVDISPFISALPRGQGTERFSTADGSGSTSQAAAIQEAVEAGATTLLIDEDTSATNFMVRDARMRALVAADREPITPFVRRVRTLAAAGVSTVLVVGGTGDYFDRADLVLGLDEYRIADRTADAHAIARAFAQREGAVEREEGCAWRPPIARAPLFASVPAEGEPGGGSSSGVCAFILIS